MSCHQPNLENVFSIIGFGLTHIQSVEKVVKFTTTYVLQGSSPLTLDKLNALSIKERKQTLGQYFGKIKDRADLHPLLNELINRYLQARNDFIHNQEKIPGWDLETEVGIETANLFTLNMIKDGNSLMEILTVLMTNWSEQIELPVSIPTEHQNYFDKIKNQYTEHLDVLFTKKT